MKILLLQDHLRSGGTERQSILLARAFAAAGHAAVLLTFRPGGALAGELAGVTHRPLTRRDLHLDWFAPGLRRAVAAKARARRIDWRSVPPLRRWSWTRRIFIAPPGAAATVLGDSDESS